MKTARSLQELRQTRKSLSEPVGFVPTMGYLHAGHLSLVERARQECASVVVSIFVNPLQFGPGEDLNRYPRDLERDLHLLEPLAPDLVWMPEPEDLYPLGYQTHVDVEKLTMSLEGAVRPGHFRGVATVVAKLFNAVQPHRAYFGQKDAQQAAVIQRMTVDLNFPVEVIVCPTVREADGLAMSSRNSYLNGEERQAATVLFRALCHAKTAYDAGERDADMLRDVMKKKIQAEPLAGLQYVSCANAETLQELENVTGKTLLSMAVFIGKTRLIDNIILG